MKRRGTWAAAIAIALLLPATAVAQEMREFCADRPGLGSPACAIDRGHLAVELGLIDWMLDRSAEGQRHTLLTGDLLLRYGITDVLEARAGWTAFGHARERSAGMLETSIGTGDVVLAVLRNLRNPDGTGFAVAVLPFVTLPTGGDAIGAGTWGAGLLLPITRDLPAGLQLGVTGSIGAAVDAARDGRHLAYGAVVGLGVPVADAVGVTFELSATRDRDPSGAVTTLIGGVSAAWSPTSALQLDVGVNAGLDEHTPDLQLYLGAARRY